MASHNIMKTYAKRHIRPIDTLLDLLTSSISCHIVPLVSGPPTCDLYCFSYIKRPPLGKGRQLNVGWCTLNIFHHAVNFLVSMELVQGYHE